MRLLHTKNLRLKVFNGPILPPYVILSHTWGSEEVTYADLPLQKAPRGEGYRKLVSSCNQARSDGFEWIWVDTCCIDKSSSAELSEAVNSMYRWYQDAHICYAYLADVTYSGQEHDILKQLKTSRWLTRGWTLQELIAPEVVEFYDRNWEEIGTKSSLRDILHEATGIDLRVLRGDPPTICNVASRMSWASSRETTRIEDMAYSLLGLLDVNMPLLYGEGMNAFKRLQEQILGNSTDYTVFAWRDHDGLPSGDGVLAPSPANFCRTGHCSTCSKDEPWSYSALSRRWKSGAQGTGMTDSGPNQTVRRPRVSLVLPTFMSGRLQLTIPVLGPASVQDSPGSVVGTLSKARLAYIGYRDVGTGHLLCLKLNPDWEDGNDFCRTALVRIPPHHLNTFESQTITLISWRNVVSKASVTLQSSLQHHFKFKQLPACFTRVPTSLLDIEVDTPVPGHERLSECRVFEASLSDRGDQLLRRKEWSFALFKHMHSAGNEWIHLRFTPASGIPICELAVTSEDLPDARKRWNDANTMLRRLADRSQVLSTLGCGLVSVNLKRRPNLDGDAPSFKIKLNCQGVVKQ